MRAWNQNLDINWLTLKSFTPQKFLKGQVYVLAEFQEPH